MPNSTLNPDVKLLLASSSRGDKRILVVDDNETNRKVLRAILESADMAVLEAQDGVEALSILRKGAADAVISDILLPRMDGYRLCLEIRKNEGLRALPFIIYTGVYTSSDDRQMALDVGVDRYITKPDPARTILDAIRELGTRRYSPPTTAPASEDHPGYSLIKEYSQQLVAKLGERNIELNQLAADLRGANDKLRHLLKHSPAVIYGLRRDGEKVVPHVVSDNVTELLGFSVEEALQPEWWKGQLHPDDRQRAIESLADTFAKGSSRTEYRLRHKDGTWRWVEDNRRFIRNATDPSEEFVGVWADITEHKNLEAKVAGRDRQLEAFFSNATAGLCILDLDFRFVQLNETLAGMNGMTVEQHLGRSIRELMPDLAPTIEPILQRVLATSEPALNMEIGGRTPAQPHLDRQWIGSYFPLISDSGKPTGIGSVVVEVTERKAAEEALRVSESRFRQLTDHIQEVFWIVTPDLSELIYVSPAYSSIWGRSVESLYANPLEWMNAILPEDQPQVTESFAKLAAGAPQISVEYRIRRPDGSLIWLHDRGFPVLDANGKLYRFAGISKDITQQKHLEESLRRAQKMEAIGQLAGGIAHDFNNMLACILGYTELAVTDAAGNAAVQSELQEVLKASQRARELVLQILTFSRQQEQERKPIKLKTVIKEALKLLRASLPSTIEINADLGEDSVFVLADATQIHQIIMNLATNASHAMNGRGRLEVELCTVTVDEELARTNADLRLGPCVRLSVVDNGIGMDGPTLQRVFEPFFTTKAPGQGTGLGLAVIHGIVKGHEGAITVSSEPGLGTTFRLYFPIHGTPAGAPASANEPTPRGCGEHILFVDDEAALAQLGAKILERYGYRVTVLNSGMDALVVYRTDPDEFDLVVTDLTMPKMSGVELASELLAIRPDVPVILATGFGGNMTQARVKALGLEDLLLKPITAETLLASVHRALIHARVG